MTTNNVLLRGNIHGGAAVRGSVAFDRPYDFNPNGYPDHPSGEYIYRRSTNPTPGFWSWIAIGPDGLHCHIDSVSEEVIRQFLIKNNANLDQYLFSPSGECVLQISALQHIAAVPSSPAEHVQGAISMRPAAYKATVINDLLGAAQVIDPGVSGAHVQVHFGPDRVLRAALCVDGKCYRTEVDLGHVLDAIKDQLAAYHAGLHGQPPTQSGADLSGDLEQVARQAAQDLYMQRGVTHIAFAVTQSGGSQVMFFPTADQAASWLQQQAHAPGLVYAAIFDASAPNFPTPTNYIAAMTSPEDAAVKSAGQYLVGGLLDHHRATISAGWWHDLTKKVSGAIHGVEHAAGAIAGTVGHTLVALKGPIAAAAAAAATAELGPEAGPIASQLTTAMIGVATGTGSVKQAAQQVLQTAQQAAQSNPQIAAAYQAAQNAVARTTAAYHVAQTVASAAQGNPAAQQAVLQLGQAAAQGDPAAQQAMQIAQGVQQVAQGNAANGGPPPTDPQQLADQVDPTVAQGAIEDLRKAASQAVIEAHGHIASPALGFVRHAAGFTVLPFQSLDQADDWYGQLPPGSFVYAAYYDATDPTWPAPVNETLGHPATVSSGFILPFLFGAGLGAAGGYGYAWYRGAKGLIQTSQAIAPYAQPIANAAKGIEHIVEPIVNAFKNVQHPALPPAPAEAAAHPALPA